MTYFDCFNRVKDELAKYDVSDYNSHLAVQVNLTGEGEGAFYIELNCGKMNIEPYEYYDRDILLTINTGDLLAIINGTLDPVFAFSIGKIKVSGDIGRVLELKRVINKHKML
ncbi:MAG: SCP2 sterol-binding domain-containing protein [Acutalibacteraceae bacterium]|nr:SCP2 sterol-binding domain-containing protein [Acutalibacteraceae bacterium]